MATVSLDPYRYVTLLNPTSFRVAELLPGKDSDPVSCLLHQVDWSDLLEYDAISYAWGDPNAKAPVIIGGKMLQVTKNLHACLNHLRYEDRSVFLWADALCINQTDIPERGAQVKQMRKIYESAKAVSIWLGPDNEAHQAPLAIDSIRQITKFLCQKLGISFADLILKEEVYHDIIFKNRGQIPLPHECDFVTNDMWESLLWLYKHPYFTRLWAIQEINANNHRMVHCGNEIVQWDAVELIAGYIILDEAFSTRRGFTDAYCWWASTAPSELRQAKNWLHMLYLASNFTATDPRDVIYGLRGMMKTEEGGGLLDPDYCKSTIEVYRDSVEAAFINYKTTNALLYVSGVEDPSWVPRWDRPMLFRNPFRFGKPIPWKPAGESQSAWSIDKDVNILSLSGFVLNSIEYVEPYNETYFGSTMIASDEGKLEIRKAWHRILGTMTKSLSHIPFSDSILTATATSFSFGLDRMCDPTNERRLFHDFVAYLKNVLDEETYNKYISLETSEKCKNGDGNAFGKPVWDFEYPVASFFITKGKMIGCSIALITPGDLVFVPLGSVYPLVLRSDNDLFRIRGFCFVHGIMQGEKQDSPLQVVEIH